MTAVAAPARQPTARQIAARPLVRAWLWGLALLVLAMVVVGGATRLTGSGLSITEWAPVTGVVPPLSEPAWRAEFDRYRAIPQYRLVNRGMSLHDFKTIYWWEWSHRFLGRLLGVAFLAPFLWLALTGRLERRLAPWVLGAFALGALQGVVGWYMVASGLSERVAVSQYRLAFHLALAAGIFAYLLWLAEGQRSRAPETPPPRRIAWAAGTILGLVLVQIFIGALVAGLHAGLAYATWPLMDGRLAPPGLFGLEPWWRNFFENVAMVQFAHRLTGYLLVAATLAHAIDRARRAGEGAATARAALLASLVLAQAGIGIATLLAGVPLALALAHQLGAFAILAVAVVHLRALLGSNARAPSEARRPAGAAGRG